MDKTNGKTTKKSQKRHNVLRKVLIMFLVLLLASIAFLSYLLVVERRKNNKLDSSKKNKGYGNDLTICTKKNCILNSADTSSQDMLRKMDSSVDPCEDFYSYACGTYDKTMPIPSHMKSIHVLSQLQTDNRKFLKSLLENPKIRKYYSKNIPVTKLLNAYDTCLGVSNMNRVGIQPFKELIDEMGGSNISSTKWQRRSYDVFKSLLQIKQRVNLDVFFKTGVWISPKNSSNHVFYIWSTKLGLKNDLYLHHKTPRNSKTRHLYKSYMIKMMKHVHGSRSDVRVLTNEIFNLEKKIARIYLTYSSEKEEPPTIGNLSQYTKFDWLTYLQNLTENINYTPSSDNIILVESQDILKHIIQLINKTETRILSNYIAWSVFRKIISALPEHYSRIQQAFFNSIQTKPTEQPRRWEVCVEILSETLESILSFLYVDQKFSKQSRERAFEIFYEIRREFIDNLRNKRWMDDKTKREATEKANGINFLVGFNDNLKSPKKLKQFYHEFHVNRSDFLQTYLNQRKFQFLNEIKQFLRPVKKNSFNELTSNANAYYSRQENKISFMAGILQRPFYDKDNSRASNYGALGMFVGHELTHAFDSNGHQYDKDGDLRNWWTKFSLINFLNKTRCFIKQYEKFSIFGQRVKGAGTLGESIADNGGLKLAYRAYKRSEKSNGQELRLPGLNLTNDQVFFLSFAQNWCSKYTEDGVKEIIETRVPMMFRATGAIRNSIDFSKAFNCPLKSQMNPELKCDLW